MEQRHKEEEHENEERWLLTYADLITLLMVFFVVMYAISKADTAKFAQLSASMRNEFGKPETTPIPTPPPYPPAGKRNSSSHEDSTEPHLPTRLQQAERRLREIIKERGLEERVTINGNPAGTELTIRLADSLLFEPGKAGLTPPSQELIEGIGGALKDLTMPISVSGHTDSIPVSNAEFPSNWELSTARSTSVVRYMIDHMGMEPYLLSAGGYAEFHPVAPNDTPDNRARNRRVEFVITDTLAKDTVAEPEPQPEMARIAVPAAPVDEFAMTTP